MLQRRICRGVLLVTLAPGAVFPGLLAQGVSADQVARPAAPPLRVHCAAPATLKLRRFEDRSAQLRCAGRVLVRVSVPG